MEASVAAIFQSLTPALSMNAVEAESKSGSGRRRRRKRNRRRNRRRGRRGSRT
jgi:hypothetical protein